MRQLIFTALLLFTASGFSQIGDPIGTDSKKEEKKDVLLCRDQRFRMIPDCNGLVYVEKRPLEDGRTVDLVFHNKTGRPYSGECKVCHNNGNLYMYLKYQNGFSVGKDTVYYEDGTVNLIRAHDEEGRGTEHGSWKLYREDGSLMWEKEYQNGLAHGEHRYYFPDSTLKKIEVWESNALNGKKQEFYEGGQIKKEVNYKNGEWDGRFIIYFEDGKVKSEQIYSDGEKEGPSTYYYRNGKIMYTENHEKGKREGEFKRFYANGKKFTVEHYRKDQRHGHFEEYYDNEKNVLKYSAEYKKGELLEEHFYDEFGDETAPPEKPKEDGEKEEDDDKKKKKKDKE